MNGRLCWRYRTPTERHAGVPLCGVGAPGVARQRSSVGERQALTPQNADRVIVAGERVERGAGEKAHFFRVSACCAPGPSLGNGEDAARLIGAMRPWRQARPHWDFAAKLILKAAITSEKIDLANAIGPD
jgi:hypothetical protein